MRNPISPEIMNFFLLDSPFFAMFEDVDGKPTKAAYYVCEICRRYTLRHNHYRSRCNVAILERKATCIRATFKRMQLSYTWVELKWWRAPIEPGGPGNLLVIGSLSRLDYHNCLESVGIPRRAAMEKQADLG